MMSPSSEAQHYVASVLHSITYSILIFSLQYLQHICGDLKVSVGQMETCSLWFGEYKCWGQFSNNAVPPSSPYEFGAGFEPYQIISGQLHHCIISNHGKVRCWGDNRYGQLGYGNTDDIAYGTTLEEVDLGTDFYVEDGGAGTYHSCFLSNQSQIKCIGYNLYGQLGYGDEEDRGDDIDDMGDALPVVDLGHTFVPMQLAVGGRHNCALSTNSDIKCWGSGDIGGLGYGHSARIGDGANEMGDDLSIVDLGTFVCVQLVAGGSHSCAISDEGSLKCWGWNSYGQLGLGDTNNRGDDGNEMGDYLSIIDVGADFAVKELICGSSHNCVISTSDYIKCFGYGIYGQLGYGNINNVGDASAEMGDDLIFVDLGSTFNVSRLEAGPNALHSCAISTDDDLKCWGWNYYYQLGLGDTNDRGDDANEMGDALPLISIPISTPSPTSIPSLEPTMNPSLEPSNGPTIEPTLEPTTYPSNPTHIPSVDPSVSPTIEPTVNPSIEPIPSPSHTPTTLPTALTNPTSFPTKSPSMCIDYEMSYNSSDGVDQIHSLYDVLTLIYSIFPDSIQNHNDDLSGETVFCDSASATTCQIWCEDSGYCDRLIVDLNNVTVSKVYILCDEGCWEMNVQINASNIGLVHIQCSKYLSCYDASISIETTIATSFIMECNQTKSCADVTVNLTATERTGSIMANITCFGDNSCDEMVIDTNDASGIEIELNALRYSEDITIYHAYYERVRVNCGYSLDSIYIEYPNNALLDEFTILRRARSKYINKRLPCEDIQLICPHSMEHCEFEYHLDVNPYALANRSDDADCFWMDIVELYHANCDGTCAEVTADTSASIANAVEIPNVYHQSFQMDLILETSTEWTHNHTNKTESFMKCCEFFGSINDTEESMRSIDAVFEHVLNVMVSDPGSIIFDFYGIESTTRRDIECFNVDTNTIALITNLTIESLEDDRSVIDGMFADDSTFVKESSKLLSKLFGVHVVFDVIEVGEIVTKKVGLAAWQLVLLIIGVLLITILLGLILYRYCRMRNRILMTNPLVIAIGIAEYEDSENVESPEVNGTLQSLPTEAIRKDIRNLYDLFCGQLNYSMFPEYDIESIESCKVHWTKQEIIDLFKEKARYLAKNLDVHDGLVVITSSHGKDGSILSSDYKKIPKLYIHRLFTMSSKMAKIREIPRLFLFDCCDGNFDRTACLQEMKGKEPEGKEININHDVMKSEEVGVLSDALSMHSITSSGCSATLGSGDMTLRQVEAEVGVMYKDDGSWKEGSFNPDHKLAVIHAANEDFESKMKRRVGSYLIYYWTKMVSRNMDRTWYQFRGQWYLGEIMNEIQRVLEERGKQLVISVYTNGTERIVFGRNSRDSSSEDAPSALASIVKANLLSSKEGAENGVNEVELC